MNEPTPEMQWAFEQDTPYICRLDKTYSDGRPWVVLRQDHPEWRELVAEPMTVLGRYATHEEAADHFDRLEFLYRWQAALYAHPSCVSPDQPTPNSVSVSSSLGDTSGVASDQSKRPADSHESADDPVE